MAEKSIGTAKDRGSHEPWNRRMDRGFRVDGWKGRLSRVDAGASAQMARSVCRQAVKRPRMNAGLPVWNAKRSFLTPAVPVSSTNGYKRGHD